jgi:3-phenylpropionate/trans-cinnamate dioxygenase ferredoxin reductase subunit
MSDNFADVVIIGASHAGSEFAARLRQGGFAGAVALLSSEPHLPYHRPPLSKGFLSGETSSEQLLLRSEAAYAKANIGWHPSTTITEIDRASHTLKTSAGGTFRYGKLVLATGGRPRRLAIPGADLQGLHVMRSIADVDALRPAFIPGSRLVIAGGGYIGLEVAAVAAKYGLDVEVVEFAPRLLARVAGPELSAFYEAAHRAHGVKFRLNTGVQAFEPAANNPNQVGFVRCSDGTLLPADLVLVAVGLIPNTELAQEAGLAMGNGIVVDDLCQTSDPDILAIGDCTEHPLPFLEGARVRLESVPNAVEQARVAASVLNGVPKPYNAVPWFWSDQYHLKLQSVGLSQGHDQIVLRPARSPEGFVAFYLKQGRMIAADCVNSMQEFNQAKRLITEKIPVDPVALADPETNLKSLLPVAA